MQSVSVAGAVWWWIGVVALFVVVLPLVLVLAFRVLTHLREIGAYANDVLAHGLGVTGNLDPVPALLETRDLVKHAGAGLGRYAGAVGRLLAGKP